MAFKAVRFAYAHPRFGRSKNDKKLEPYKNTVYYLWWEFLRRSRSYQKCCLNGGKGQLKGLYDDFGDVFEVDFKTWWQHNDRGAFLFAERLPPEMKVISEIPTEDVLSQVLFIQVPLALPKRLLAAEFQRLLNENHEGRKGRRNNVDSTARYPVSGHIDTIALQKCLRVLDVKRSHLSMPLWQVTQEARAIQRQGLIASGDTPAVITNKKLILANTASRLLKKATLIIKNVENGRFPF